MKLVETGPEASDLRQRINDAANRASDLSIEAGALAGMLGLIAGSDQFTENQKMAFDHLAEMAQRLENGIEALSAALSEQPDR